MNTQLIKQNSYVSLACEQINKILSPEALVVISTRRSNMNSHLNWNKTKMLAIGIAAVIPVFMRTIMYYLFVSFLSLH